MISSFVVSYVWPHTKDLGHFPYQSAHEKSISLASGIAAHILAQHWQMKLGHKAGTLAILVSQLVLHIFTLSLFYGHFSIIESVPDPYNFCMKVWCKPFMLDKHIWFGKHFLECVVKAGAMSMNSNWTAEPYKTVVAESVIMICTLSRDVTGIIWIWTGKGTDTLCVHVCLMILCHLNINRTV